MERPDSGNPATNLQPTIFQKAWYALLSSTLLLLIIHLFTDIIVNGFLPILVAVLVVQVLQIVIQPAFSWVARLLGLIGILLISLFSYAVIIWLTFNVVPGIENVKFDEALVVAWVYALVVTLLQWIMLAQSDDYFLQNAIRSAKKQRPVESDVPGFVFVQLDGVSHQVLKWQLHTGNLPNIKRLVDDGYELRPWRTQIPSTTPASQAGILFGSNEGIPAFRWYERAGKKLLAANQPASASLIESRLSTGHGLLSDGGVSIGNIFSGDAQENIMVISKMKGDRQSLRTLQEYSAYFSNLYGFMRAFVLSLGEMVKEVYQAKRQQVKDIQPRVPRKGSYVALRAATNVMLRDLQTTIVLDKMMRGANAIYVDYTDYDEIAHHAGIARPESLAALSGLDSVVGILTKATAYTARPYNLVFLSDHGQSQGPTFRQLHSGKNLEDFAMQLAGTTDIVITGSGNLGNIWLKKYSSRPTKEQLEKDYPGFIRELLKIEGTGLVLVASDKQGPVCIGRQGEISLKNGKVSGTDPLRNYAPVTARELYKLSSMANAPDIQVISDINLSSGEVYAFEELVGNHGGVGGWQTDALLLHPKNLKIPHKYLQKGEIIDSAVIHRVFIDWLEQAGHRTHLE